MVAVTIHSNFRAQENKICHCFPQSICHEVMGWGAMIFVYWMLSFKPAFSFSSYTFIKRLLSSSSFSAIKVVSYAYLRLLISLPAILIPVCASSSRAFWMMHSAYLNKQYHNIQPWHTPFPILNQPIFSCPVLTVAICPAYKFLRKQLIWSCIPISKNFPVCCDPHGQRL